MSILNVAMAIKRSNVIFKISAVSHKRRINCYFQSSTITWILNQVTPLSNLTSANLLLSDNVCFKHRLSNWLEKLQTIRGFLYPAEGGSHWLFQLGYSSPSMALAWPEIHNLFGLILAEFKWWGIWICPLFFCVVYSLKFNFTFCFLKGPQKGPLKDPPKRSTTKT